MQAHAKVAVDTGVIRGESGEGWVSFLGIPYAHPPVGDFRFAAPAPAPAWSGVREATRFGPVPPQSMLAGGPQCAGVPLIDSDEWLTVNVWTPDPHANSLPVLVWIYGGAYMSGSSANPTLNGARLARGGRMVVVTFNYRLAVEGFTCIDDAPPNRGLLDQVAALSWVRDNIAAFGGDPRRVTLAGQSAGAGSVASLLVMPDAAGLFQQAIVQSLPRPYATPALGRAVAAELAASLDRPANRAALRTYNPARLIAAGDELTRHMTSHRDSWGVFADTPSPYCPVIDGDVLPRNPWQALSDGAAAGLPLMVGHTRDEYRLFLALAGQLDAATAEETERALHTFAPGHDGAAYRAAHPAASDEHLFELIHSDWLFRMPSLALASAHLKAGTTFMYELALDVVDGGQRLGSMHGSDVPLVFGNFTGGSAATVHPRTPSAATRALSRTMRTAWSRFVHTGDPGWPAFDRFDAPTQIFDTVPRMSAYPERASAELWRRETYDALDLRGE